MSSPYSTLSANQRELIALGAGMVSSVAVMWVAAALADEGYNFVGFFLFHVVPVGALIVGLISGLGYAIAARKMNITLSTSFVGSMMLISLLNYVTDHYMTYSSMMERLKGPPEYSFLHYLKDMCEHMVLTKGEGYAGAAIGRYGYLFKGLELAGFIAGSMIPAKLAVRSVAATPDCAACGQYYVAERFGYLNAPEQVDDLAELTREERGVVVEKATAALLEKSEAFMESLKNADLIRSRVAMLKLEGTADTGNIATVSFTLHKCPGCHAFKLNASMTGYDADETFFRQDLRSIEGPAKL